MHRVPDSIRRALTDVDGDHHVAIAAEARHRRAWQPIGIGRLVTDNDGVAELAVSVVDAWQGHGVGTRLVRALVDHARTAGVREIVAEVMADNAAMLRVLRRELPVQRTQRHGDVLHLLCHVPGQWDLTITHEDIVASLTW